MQILEKIIAYFRESKIELKKVVWPTRREAVNHTLLVIAVLDYIFTVGLEKLITR
jgi:preprotein translocase subunit SecE